jgi:hypothetical protein
MEALFSDYEAIRKSGLFDPEHYATAYPDVAERNVDPLVHYLEEARGKGATHTRISTPPSTSNSAGLAARSRPTHCCIIC